MKFFFWILLAIIVFTFIMAGILNGGQLYEPEFKLLDKKRKIEIRQYADIILATTKAEMSYKEATHSGFRVLANYIFGNNKSRTEIPMTAPVLTNLPGNDYINISFVMSKDYTMESLPKPNNDRIRFHTLSIGKAVVVKFGMWATPQRINKMKSKLEKYLNDNNLEVKSDFYVAQYNSPWALPPFRRNEIIVSIK